MTLHELDAYFSAYLDVGAFSMDTSLNGVQVSNRGPKGTHIGKIAFAVDAGLETINRARNAGAGLLFVHHGLFWGECERIIGAHYGRVRALLDADMALYACHLPLDAHKVSGNNYGLARRLGLDSLAPFGEWRGAVIGVMGELPGPRGLSPQDLTARLNPGSPEDCKVFPFGKKEIRTVAVVSGGGDDLIPQAAAAGADAYVTGEVKHQWYHLMQELGITVIAGGHYATETLGVSLMKELVSRELGIETVFVDVPTGL